MPHNGDWEEIGNVGSEEGIDASKEKQRKVPSCPDVTSLLSEIMKPELECFIGRVEHFRGDTSYVQINKKAELALAKQMHPCSEKWEAGNETHLYKSGSLQLQFLDEFSVRMWTGGEIEGKDNPSIGIALFDGFTRKLINSGPVASAKVEIVAIEHDRNGYEGDVWSQEEFNSKIALEERKSPLIGDVYLNLVAGIGYAGNIHFRHNANWTRTQRYRLVARIVGVSHGVRVREAMTKPFIIKDRRAKLCVKHYHLSLSDEVWRLINIRKGGAFHRRLSKENINTVKDFLTLLNINPQRLKGILGGSMHTKFWDKTVGHARTCEIDNRAYLYYSPRQVTSVIFNVVGQLMGLLLDQQLVSVDKLSETQKADALELVVLAFQHWGEVVPVEDETSLTAGSQQLADALYPSYLTTQESSNMIDPYGNMQQDTNSTDIISLGRSATNVDDIGLFGGEKLDFEQSNIPNCLISNLGSVRQYVGDDDASFLNVRSIQPNVLHPSNSVIPESCYDNEIVTSHNICGPDNPQLGASSHESVPFPRWDVDFFRNFDFQSIDYISHRCEQTLTFASTDTSSLISDTDSLIRAFYEDEQLQISGDHCSIQHQDPNWNLWGDPHNAVLACSSDVTMNKALRRQLPKRTAQRRWKMLFSIMRWISVRRGVGRKALLDEICKDPSASSQAKLHGAVNDIRLARSAAVSMNKAQRRYLSKSEKAQRRWRMLFSIMRWISVKRNVAAREIPFREMPKDHGPSSGDVTMPAIYFTGGMNGLIDNSLWSIDIVEKSPELFSHPATELNHEANHFHSSSSTELVERVGLRVDSGEMGGSTELVETWKPETGQGGGSVGDGEGGEGVRGREKWTGTE